ncbi:hypothetical protein [uncultured Friedmanniella sp.]|uniref:hypothetical protein n=1 Tax=uncultured Friedmanniella sp. TaxID=335381 RepID=UPI0035C97DBA
MRTEALLREAMTDLAATARTPEAALPRLLASLPTPASTARRHRRRVLVVALAAVLLVVAVAGPGLFRRQTAVPVGRVPGNWNLIHRVDLPAGWEVQQRAVSAGSESSSYRSSTTAATADAQCTVEVLAAGRRATIFTSRLVALDVNGHVGTFGNARDEQSGRVEWAYADNSFASVSCGPADQEAKPWSATTTQRVELDFARRVVFEPTPLRLPFQLDALPAGYAIHDVVDADDVGHPGQGISLYPTDKSANLPPMYISVNPGTTEVKPGIPGQETTTLDGRPAVLSATEGSLCMDDRGYAACIVTDRGEPADLNVSLWPAGRRELLLEVASHLRVTKHLDDPSRWPDANVALPR